MIYTWDGNKRIGLRITRQLSSEKVSGTHRKNVAMLSKIDSHRKEKRTRICFIQTLLPLNASKNTEFIKVPSQSDTVSRSLLLDVNKPLEISQYSNIVTTFYLVCVKRTTFPNKKRYCPHIFWNRKIIQDFFLISLPRNSPLNSCCVF